MKSDDFNNVIEAQIERSTSVLINKAAEYASDDDRLHNFKVAASMQGCTPAQALAGMMAKHTTSIFDMVRSGEGYTTAMWNEKITDHINYLLLLRAVVEEGFNSVDEQTELDEAISKIDWDIPRHNRRKRAAGDLLDLVMPTREDALNVIDVMQSLVANFGEGSVYDLYELVGVTGTFTDKKWGWTDFRAHVTKEPDGGYLIVATKPQPLLRDDNEIQRKAIEDQTALNDIAAHLARLLKRERSFRGTDLNEVFNIVERVRVVDPETEKGEDEEDEADKTALDDIAAIFADEDADDKLQSIFDIVDKVRVTDPDAEYVEFAQEGASFGSQLAARRLNLRDQKALDEIAKVVTEGGTLEDMMRDTFSIVRRVRTLQASLDLNKESE